MLQITLLVVQSKMSEHYLAQCQAATVRKTSVVLVLCSLQCLYSAGKGFYSVGKVLQSLCSVATALIHPSVATILFHWC